LVTFSILLRNRKRRKKRSGKADSAWDAGKGLAAENGLQELKKALSKQPFNCEKKGKKPRRKMKGCLVFIMDPFNKKNH